MKIERRIKEEELEGGEKLELRARGEIKTKTRESEG